MCGIIKTTREACVPVSESSLIFVGACTVNQRDSMLRLSVGVLALAFGVVADRYYACTVDSVLGCYQDNFPPHGSVLARTQCFHWPVYLTVESPGQRILPHCAQFEKSPTSVPFSLEACASLCAEAGFTDSEVGDHEIGMSKSTARSSPESPTHRHWQESSTATSAGVGKASPTASHSKKWGHAQ